MLLQKVQSVSRFTCVQACIVVKKKSKKFHDIRAIESKLFDNNCDYALQPKIENCACRTIYCNDIKSNILE